MEQTTKQRKWLIDAAELDSKLEFLARKYAEQGRFEAAKDYSFVQTVLLTAPMVDAVEVVPGRWELIRNAYGDIEGWIHRDCGREVKTKENYCPNCGAKMDAEKG